MSIKKIGDLSGLAPNSTVKNKPILALGIADLDSYTKGGIKAGDVWLIAGRPQMGCATFAMRIALLVVNTHKTPVLYFSGHEALADVAHRLIKMHAMADPALPVGDLAELPQPLLQKAATALSQMPLFIATDWPRSLEAIESALVQAIGNPPEDASTHRGVVIIDSLQRLQATSSLSLSAIASGVKAMAQKYGVSFLMTSGLDRKLEGRKDKRPGFWDIKKYPEMVPWIDQVLCLYRDKVYDPDSDLVGHLEIIGHTRSLHNDDVLRSPHVTEVSSWSYGNI